MICENCKHCIDKGAAWKWLCMKYPKDENNFVSSKERITEPYYRCTEINGFGQCKYYDELRKEK